MPKFSNLLPISLRPKGGRRMAVWTAAVAMIALVGGVLQTAAATSIFQTEPINTQTQLQSLSTENKSVAGEQVTYKATVTSDTGTPTAGTVDFLQKENDSFQPITGCSDEVLNASGEATCEHKHESVGTYILKAQYSDGPSIYADSADEVTQTVGQAGTTTTLTSSDPNNATVSGESVTYTATVTANSPSAGTPAGTVTFYNGTTPICSSVTLVSGSANCITTFLAVGSPHSVTAEYLGNTDYLGDTSDAIIQTVAEAPTTTTLTSSDHPDNATVTGEPVTFTATVSADAPGSGTPTGTVTFKNGTAGISSCTLKQMTSGVAQCATSFKAVGSPHSVTAVYNDDSNYLTSTSSAISHAVTKANTTTAVSSGLNPSKTGQNVTYTAVVMATAPGAGFPDGTVHFKDGTATVSSCSAVQLVNGQAQCTAVYNSVGNRSITAVYSGSNDYFQSTSPAITQVVNYAYTLTATGGSSNATFRISGNPRLPNYRLCVRYFGYQGVEGNWPAATPPPVAAHSGIHMYGINFDNKCKKIAWPSGATSDTDQLLDSPLGGDDFGFAAKGTYEVSWYTCGNGTCSANGALIGKQQFSYSSWCPPNVGGFRQKGVWRTSRHKVIDSCFADTGNPSGLDSHFDKDRSVNMNGMHNEFVARDYLGSYGAPAEALGAQGNGYTSNVRTYVGVKVCDTYHRGKRELHPMFMAQGTGGTIWLGGAHYSTKTPSISGTWKRYAC